VARTIVIGDIHGCWDELRDLFDALALTDDDIVVSVGDLVDRGPEPVAVVDWFRARANAVVVCGNHERKHVRGTLSYGQHIVRHQFGARYADAVAWMGTLPYAWETDAVRVVHAALIPGVPLADTPEDILCGSTSGTERLEKRLAPTSGGRPWHELYTDDKPVVFGHIVVGPEPLVRDGRVYGIDTGACHGMRLTALVLPTFELVSVPSRGDHWATTKRTWQVPILRERAWGQMTFEQLDRKARELAVGMDADAHAWLDGARAWAVAVQDSIPTVAAALDAEIVRLTVEHGEAGFAAAAAAHPANATLFARRAGRLQTEHLGCPGPDAVFALATRLGITLPVPPTP
jgi:serine/threonine protein phosphatase 1